MVSEALYLSMQIEDRLHGVTRAILIMATIVAFIAIGLGAVDVAAAQTEDEDVREDFDQDNSTASNNITITNGEIQIQRENLSWDVNNLTLNRSVSLTGIENTVHNIEWGKNGSKFYLLDADYTAATTELQEYTVSDPYNVATASHERTVSFGHFLQGLEWGRKGTRLYVADVANDTIDTYAISDAWNISAGTGSVLGTTDYSADLSEDPSDFQVSPGGEHFYYLTQTAVHRAPPLAAWFPDSPASTHSLPTGVTSARNLEFQDGNTNLNFSGLNSGDYVEVTDSTTNTELDIEGDVTVALEANISRPIDQTTNNDYRQVFGKGTGPGQYTLIIEEGGAVDWSVFVGGSRESVRGCNVPIGKPFTLVARHDITTGDSSVWMNGTQCASGTVASGTLDTNNDNVFLSTSTGAHQYPGELDRVRLAESYWSDSEIQQYADGKEVSPSSRRLEFDMDLGNGTILQDTAGTANDGTINNPDWVSGSFGGAGDRLFVLDNKDGTNVSDDTLYQIGLGHNFGISSMTLQDSTTGTSGLQDESDNRGMAWNPAGTKVTLQECCNGDSEEFNAGFRSGAYARYRYIFGPGPFEEVLKARLNWTEEEIDGPVHWYLGNGDNPIHFHNVSNEENVWQDFSDQNEQALHVRVNLTWEADTHSSPTATIFQVAVDTNDATALNLTVPEEMGLNESANYNVCVEWENGTCTDVSQDGDTDVTVNRTNVLQVFKSNTTLRSNTNSSWVAVNASTSADLQTLVANESTLVFANRLQDYRFIDDEIIPIVVFTDWGWLALLVIATIAALVGREVGVDLGIATFGGLVVVAWILGFVELEIVIVAVLLVGILISR